MLIVHTPFSSRRNGDPPSSQSLKSPTIATLEAEGFTNTNRISCSADADAGVRIAAGGARTAGAVDWARAARATTPASPAASASAPSGDTLIARDRVIQPQTPDLRICLDSSRTRCITRASKSGATVAASLRSVIAIRSITSSLSCTVNLPQLISQPVTRSLHPHLQRGHADPGRGRDFLVAQILDMLQQKGFPLLHRQALERAPDFLPPCHALLGVILRRIAERDLVMHDRALPSSATRPRRATPIHQNPEQPRAETLRILAPRQRAVRANERVLQRLLGVLDAPEHVRREADVPAAVADDEKGVRLDVAVQHAPNQRGVRGGGGAVRHRGGTRREGPGVTGGQENRGQESGVRGQWVPGSGCEENGTRGPDTHSLKPPDS